MLRTEPAVQVDFATYGLMLNTFIQHLLQPFTGIFQNLIVLHHISLSKVVLLTPLNEGLFIINSLGAPGRARVCFGTSSLHLDQCGTSRFRDF